MEWLNTIVQGILLGGLYALFAAGLSLIFGIMRLVNIAHGDLIVLAAYVALLVTDLLGLNPLVSLVIVAPLMAVIGYVLQRAILNPTLGDDLLPPLLVTFGLSIIIQNGLLELFTADSRKLNAGPIEIASVQLAQGLTIGILPLIQTAVYGSDVTNLKPAPDPYLLACRRLGTDNALVIEDSEAGVASGKAAGLDVLQIKSQQELCPSLT